MILEIRHTGIVVADLEKSVAFWRDILGFTIDREMDESGSHIDAILGLKGARLRTIKLSAKDGNKVELLHFKSHPDKPAWTGSAHSTGLTHIALTVDNLDEAYLKLEAAGVVFNCRPQLSPDGKVKVTYAKGPEGILLELVEIL
ncbi:MAG: glyoxalase [Elusimicrobia bacterium CG11_big_fil_rev_8_21_14_0_20_64_6]|nr:MAG: glyoxalase [Elusimicrobia bacterium CG11_big_fil_rev_8_21_14_0_20_64_6]